VTDAGEGLSSSMAVRQVSAALAAAGLESPEADARTLVSFACGLPFGQLGFGGGLTADQQRILDQAVAERLRGKPLQHITGQAHFRTISVHVGPGVFIPRPETEILAGWAIAQIKPDWRVVELCAGSGAISLAIAAEAKPAQQWALERSPEAFQYLLQNLEGTSIWPVQADMLDGLLELNGTIDLVVANPPYLAFGAPLASDVLHDPAEALFCGPDPLAAIGIVTGVARRLLKPGGVLGCEHGDDQADQVCAIFARAGFVDISAHQDLTGRARFVVARLS
jgi:release factor glutamine methyltransferase